MNVVCPVCHGPMQDRLNGYCRTCYNAYQRDYMRKRRAAEKAKRVKPTHKMCTRCGRNFPITLRHFGRTGHRLRSWCVRCYRAYQATYYRKETLRRRRLERAWQKVLA